MLVKEDQLEMRGGSYLTGYRIQPPYTLPDCLRALLRCPEIQMGEGSRENEHDVGMGASCDYSEYESVEAFLASDDYACYRDGVYSSDYSFSGSYRDTPFQLGFAYTGIVTTVCSDQTLDLSALLQPEELP